MIAQAYIRDRVVRIFDGEQCNIATHIADLPLRSPNKESADTALALVKMRRKPRTHWRVRDWGREAVIEFDYTLP